MNALFRLNKREQAILYTSLAVITAALIYNFGAEPLFKKWKSLDNEVKLVKIQLEKSISFIKDKGIIDKEYEQYASKLKFSGSNEQETTYIINELETTARASGLKIVNMIPKPIRDMEYYKRFIVDIETESSMKSLMMFIYKVKNSPQLLKIDRLRLNTKTSQEGLLIRASMVISRITIE